jgi:hypothetical protein
MKDIFRNITKNPCKNKKNFENAQKNPVLKLKHFLIDIYYKIVQKSIKKVFFK